MGVVAVGRPPAKGMFFKDGCDRHGLGGHGKDILLTDRNAAGRDFPPHKMVALCGGGRQGNSVPHIRGSHGCGIHGSGRAIARSALDGYGNIVVNERPLGVVGLIPRVGGGDCGHRFAGKGFVVIPPVKPVACVSHILRCGERRALAVGVLGHIAAVIDGAAVRVQRHFIGACLPLGVVGLVPRVGVGDRRYLGAGKVAALVPALEVVACVGHVLRCGERRPLSVGVRSHIAAVIDGAVARVQSYLVGERRPHGVEGRCGGHGTGSKRPLAVLCKGAVTVPPVKPVACSGGFCRGGRGAAVADKLHGDCPCPAIRIKGNRIERGAWAAWAAVRISAAARGRDGKGIAARLGYGACKVIGRAACGNRAALGAAVLVELDGIAGSVCNRAPCGLAGGGGTPCKPRGSVKLGGGDRQGSGIAVSQQAGAAAIFCGDGIFT